MGRTLQTPGLIGRYHGKKRLLKPQTQGDRKEEAGTPQVSVCLPRATYPMERYNLCDSERDENGGEKPSKSLRNLTAHIEHSILQGKAI